MDKKKVYVVQFGIGGTINLIPFAAGLLVANLKKEKDILENYEIAEIIFRREEPSEIVSKISNCSIIAFCCSLWNLGLSLRVASAVRKKFPEALILFGGSAIPVSKSFAEKFLGEHPEIDMICKGEGEELLVDLCRRFIKDQKFEDTEGVIYINKKTGQIYDNPYRKETPMNQIVSPYLDGTFDELWEKYSSEFSGVGMETTRGCPSLCTFCTWGFVPYRLLREKPLEQVKLEIEWASKRKISYISLSDSNFGIKKRDVEIAKVIKECKEKNGAPNYISVSWVKNSSPEVVKISEILRSADVGFRVTISLQSMNRDVLKAIKRYNLLEQDLKKVKEEYHKAKLYYYSELILGLPLETYGSFMDGIENCLGDNIFSQVFIYLLYLLPNTQIGSSEDVQKYKLEGNVIVNRHQKNKELKEADESAEVVISSSTMNRGQWVDSFVEGYYTLALHDDRLAFFVLKYLKNEYNIKTTELLKYLRFECKNKEFNVIRRSIEKLESCALGVQNNGKSHFIEADGYDGTPYDPSEAIFLELLSKMDIFYSELEVILEKYFKSKNIEYKKDIIHDLLRFQEAVMAHPDGPKVTKIKLTYDWIKYFHYAFRYSERDTLELNNKELSIVDLKNSNGDYKLFIKNHFNIRGVPPFNQLIDEEGKVVFP